jgi:hypothetical protein
MWRWLAVLLLALTIASIIVGATWLGVGVHEHPALARLAITDRVWLPAMLALVNLAVYGLVWLLFWPGYEERCPTWLTC